MTCRDFHNYWERRVGASIEVLAKSPEMAEHARACAECSGWVRTEHLLEKHLDLVRAARPEIPSSLDAAVLGNYRRYLAERRGAIDRAGWRAGFGHALPWAAALAFAALVAYGMIVFWMPRSSTGGVNGRDRTAVSQLPVPVRAEKPTSPRVAPIPRAHGPRRGARNQGQDIEAAAPRDDSRAFQSLVYCDPISCPGALEVIRVQLPAPVLGLAQAPRRASGMVSADVLVGADGIARGIRVAE